MTSTKTTKSLLIIATACIAVSCSQPSASTNEAEMSGVTAVDDPYARPMFDDTDGSLEKLFEQNGYIYTPELESSAINGDINAQKLLVTMYAYGVGGVKPNLRKTYLLYRQMAEQGDAMSQAYAGYMLLYGEGTVADIEAGMEWLEKSANQRCGMAYFFLGDYFEKTGDIVNAKKCYNNAASLGMEEAQSTLDAINNK